MISQKQLCAILFADLCASSQLYETLGDDEAYRINHACIALLVTIVTDGGGTLVRTEGDGVLCTFGSADGAFAAALRMLDEALPGGLTLKAGIHFGPLIRDAAGCIFGDSVNVAARICELAGSGELLLSGQTIPRLDDFYRCLCIHFDTTTFKGKKEAIEIYAYQPLHEAQTLLSFKLPRNYRHMSSKYLRITQGDRVYCVAPGSERLSIGRASDCDILLAGDDCSRHHAVIEAKRDDYLLIDQSINGTYVVNQDNDFCLLKRESMKLLGSGRLCFGCKGGQVNNDCLRFQLLSRQI